MMKASGLLEISPGSRYENLEQLEQGFQQLLQKDSQNADALFILGMITFRDGRLDASVDYISKAIGLNASNADYHYYQGAALAGLGKSEEALAAYRQALHLRPDHTDAHHDLGNLLVERGRLDDAIASFQQAVSLNPEHAPSHYRLGVVAGQRGRLDEATASLEQALRLKPDLAGAAKGLGLLRARQGKLDAAVVAFQQALKAQPDDADLHNELGIVLARQRRFDDAAASYREALRLRPEHPDAHNNLGNALRARGKSDEAIACFQEALRLRPHYPEAHNNLGIALKHKGKHDEAVASYQQALRLRPNYPEAHHNLGLALTEKGKHDAALLCYQQALRLKPDYVEACGNLGEALSHLGRHAEAIATFQLALKLRSDDPKLHKTLGIAYAKSEKLDEAIASYREAIRLRPNYAEAHNDLAIALARQSKYVDAEASYRQAIACRPNYAEAHSNLGNALRNQGRFAESLECYEKALQIKPGYADAYNNQGIAFAELGRFDEAIASYTQCLRLRPNHVDAHMNRALTWLRKGDYAQGWAEYEWRWKKRNLTNRPLYMPQWNGFPLRGRRILVLPEQGNGDMIQFIRYARLLKAQGATVIVECPERLIKLLSRCPDVDQLVAQGQPLPDYDVYAPLLTLPGLLDTSTEEIPAEVPYVYADPELVERWGREFEGVREFKVGINWQGNPKYAGDRHRSIPLAHFEALARVPGVRLYSLQKNAGIEQLAQVEGKFAVTDLGSRLDEETGPFLDTAAVMKNLDLFITSDTAVAHLAGALGVPVWMALSTTPDWRWMTVREDNPWYPTMRIFRQSEHMVWPPVFERMAAELKALVPPSARARSVSVEVGLGELIDKITILEIKAERIGDPEKLAHVRRELETLERARDRAVDTSAELSALTAEIREVNEALWRIEDDIRNCDREGDFGARFVALAQSVYRTNDRRADLKCQINVLLNSEIVEVKSYA